MKFGTDNRQHDQLAKRLREAADGLPEFSEVLHTQIMAAIRQKRAEKCTRGVFPFGQHRAALRLLAAAAILLVVVGGWWGWRLIAGSSRKPGASYPGGHNLSAMVSDGTEVLHPGWLIGPLAQMAGKKLGHIQYAHLNQDARTLASFLVRELDIAPELSRRHRQPTGFRT